MQLHGNNEGCNKNRKRSTNTQLKSEKQISKLNHRDEKKKKSLTSSKNTYINEKHKITHSVENISKSSKNTYINEKHKTPHSVENMIKSEICSKNNDKKSVPNIVKTTSNRNWKNWKNSRSTSAPIKG